MVSREEFVLETTKRWISTKVSDHELERRWRLVRKAMSERDLDFLICGGGFPGGYIRWLTNRWAPSGGSIAAMPIDGDIYYASHGDAVHRKPEDSFGVKGLASCAQPNLYVDTQARLILDILKEKHAKRIGLLGLGLLPAATYAALVKGVPNADFVDANEAIAPIKAVKSEEELTFIKRAVHLHDLAIEVLKNAVRPGRTADDIMLEVKETMLLAGSETQMVHAGSAPPGTVCSYDGPTLRRIRNRDQVAALIECSGPGGYWAEVMPIVCIGGIPKELESAYETAVEAQKLLVRMARPGADPMEMLAANNQFLIEKGYPPESRLLGHSQGYDFVERPGLSPLGETIKLEAGMVIALHPTVHGEHAWAFPLSQDFLITDSGARSLQETPEGIILV